jgi:glutaredoxin-related protein
MKEKEYTFIDVAENDDITAAFFKKFPNVSKVPQIMEDDKYIGGYQELREWLSPIA